MTRVCHENVISIAMTETRLNRANQSAQGGVCVPKGPVIIPEEVVDNRQLGRQGRGNHQGEVCLLKRAFPFSSFLRRQLPVRVEPLEKCEPFAFCTGERGHIVLDQISQLRDKRPEATAFRIGQLRFLRKTERALLLTL